MRRRSFCQSALAAATLGGLPVIGLSATQQARVQSDIAATRLDGTVVTLEKAGLRDFAGSLRGTLLFPGAEGYDSARAIWNGMFDRRPALIAQCTGTADVMNAVDFARENRLLLAVRAGGHSISGKSVCEGGMMIDLTRMNGVRVDPQRRTARVEGGALLADLDHESQRFNLATTAGTVSHTGAAGLTLGGGLGRLARRYGLASDNLLSVDLITADGRFVRASADENPELFWGLRGGGGNFGIATSLEYRLHSVGPQVLSGSVMYPMNQARDVLKHFNDFAGTTPNDLHMSGVIIMPPNGKAFTSISLFYSGDFARGEKIAAPMLNFGKPVRASFAPETYLKTQTVTDNLLPHGDNYYMKSGFMTELDDRFVDTLVERFEPSPRRNNVVVLSQLGGAVGEFAADATAFPNRHANFDLMIGAQWQDDADSEANVAWGRDYYQSVSTYTDGFYTNSIMDESDAALQQNYLNNYQRLVALKNQYDPANLFRMNANIKPTRG